jgi:AcrR family transcriptional regulator
MPPSKKTHLIDCARRLFESEGFHTTGIDRILDEAGVAKMTLYNNFGSKDMLIVAVLNNTSTDMLSQLEASVAHLSDPYEQILGIFDSLAHWHDSNEFCGCMFQAAVAEFPDPNSEPAKAAQAHLFRLIELFKQMCIRAELEDANTLSSMLAMIASGANCTARQIRTALPAIHARQIAEILLERACARSLTPHSLPSRN